MRGDPDGRSGAAAEGAASPGGVAPCGGGDRQRRGEAGGAAMHQRRAAGVHPAGVGSGGGRVECSMTEGSTSDAQRHRVGRWRSERAAARFRTMEGALWREAKGAAPTAIEVPTQFGLTRAYRWPGAGTPIVFLHGGGMTSVSWAPYAQALSSRDVYAVDIMGDAGRSEPTAWISCATDMAVWLDETLAGLHIARAHLVGHSLGGFVALSTAAYRPDRVSSLVLLDPAGIAPLQMLRFMLWGVPVLLGSLAPARVRHALARRLRNPLLENKRASRLLLHGMVSHAPGFPLLGPLGDDELRAVSMPVTLLIATESEPFDPNLLAARAEALLPQVRIEQVPGAGHALTVSHLDICAARIARADT